jgi:thioredoxin 2
MGHTEGETRRRRVTVPCASCSTLNRVDPERWRAGPKCGQCGEPMLLERPVPVSDRYLERVVAGTDVPVLVDFYADWCGPCKVMAPVLDAIAREYEGRVLVAKLDADRNPTMAVRFSISGIPTLIVFRDGREYRREVGAVPRQRLEALLDDALQPG